MTSFRTCVNLLELLLRLSQLLQKLFVTSAGVVSASTEAITASAGVVTACAEVVAASAGAVLGVLVKFHLFEKLYV